ncbi:MAG TPA: 2-amino-4-hydroxy-6-hydroxymethyldihydropteridine diphosphokinase [Steroidobacteraceae bacterium]
MSTLWTPAYVAIGANLGEPIATVRRAFSHLNALPSTRLIARSRLYRSAPLGPQDQPAFVNAAAGLLTELSALDLLRELKALEVKLGRVTPAVRWGPRIIDFDLCVFGSQRIETDELTVPHPGVPLRNFVLYPLFDLAPDLEVPGHGRVRELLGRASAEGLEALPDTI